jgi:hypothetical protein
VARSSLRRIYVVQHFWFAHVRYHLVIQFLFLDVQLDLHRRTSRFWVRKPEANHRIIHHRIAEHVIRYLDFYENRIDVIEQRLLELQGSDHAMLAAAIEKGISKVGQNCRHVSWERLDKEALIALSRGIGSAALAKFCRVICQGARRAGLPDLMLWRNIDGMRALIHADAFFTPAQELTQPVRLKLKDPAIRYGMSNGLKLA